MVSSRDVSRLFLQSVVSRRVISEKLARVLWRKCVDAVKAADDSLEIDYHPDKFEEFMHGLSAQLQPIDLKLNAATDETSGRTIWVVVNTKGDDLAQVATEYTPVEIAYFKAVVEQIVLAASECYSISTMAALREVNGLKPTITKSQAEVVLESFVANGWLNKSNRNRFSLSSRTLLELQGYLKSNYEDDIHECTMCYEFVTRGVGCYIPACGARLHDHCYKQFSRDNSSCPSCRSSWSDSKKLVIVGEGAVKDGFEDGRRRTKKRNDDEDDSESDIESEEVPQKMAKATSQRVNRKGAKGKNSHAREDEDTGEEMDVDEESPVPQRRRRRR